MDLCFESIKYLVLLGRSGNFEVRNFKKIHTNTIFLVRVLCFHRFSLIYEIFSYWRHLRSKFFHLRKDFFNLTKPLFYSNQGAF